MSRARRRAAALLWVSVLVASGLCAAALGDWAYLAHVEASP